ncbi:MAG: hypothetical protein HYT15_03225 [Candidatus Magasanikbacteria bacterium]|nr:hypothetical protein [Candidatus Magasanikbacteria bacterium]
MFNYAFVDWDNTIYNTVAFETDIFNIFGRYGASLADIKKTFLKSLCTVSPHHYDYTFEEHAQFLRDLGYALPPTVEAELTALFSKDYIFADTVSFLQFLKSISKNVILLSAGDENFQMHKINGSHIVSHFDEVIIVGGDKEKYLINNYNEEKIFFVNDNVHENTLVVKEAPFATVITKFNTVRYTEDQVKEVGVPYFKTLTEIKQYVEQQIK